MNVQADLNFHWAHMSEDVFSVVAARMMVVRGTSS